MDETIESMGGADTTKEYFWTTKLDKSTKTSKWDGVESAEQEQLILKLACLGAGAKAERNVVEVVSFDHAEEKQKSCICSLKLDLNEHQNLGDLILFPPVKFNLIEGSGPVHITGNHLMMEEVDEDFSDDEDFEEMEENEMLDSSIGKITEIKNEEDEEEESEEESDEEEEEAPAPKKRKSNGKTAVITKTKNGAKTNGKSDSDSATGSPKKAVKAAPKSIEEVKAAIKKVTGGKPRKQEKFRNWVKNTFKLSNDAWMDDLWKWHQKECGI